MRSIISAVVLTALLGAGCAARVGYSATVSSDGYGPDLVYVAPGVQVIADFDEPIFYADGLYWRFYAGTWYRSSQYTGGWAYATPPPVVLRIERPHTYVHYRPAGWVSRRDRVARQPDRQRVEPRRDDPPPRQPTYRPQPPPRAQPQPPRAQPQPPPRMQPQPPRGGPPGRDHERRDDRDHGDRGDHHDRR
jgi:hypothetical protein